jgi:glutamyl-tRNA reductase
MIISRSLASVAEQNKSLREAAAKEAEIVIDYGLLQFDRWRKKLLLQPELLSLRGRVDHICRTEIEKIFNRAGMEEDCNENCV